jgi:peptide/nickel transport system substrate-binding protein
VNIDHGRARRAPDSGGARWRRLALLVLALAAAMVVAACGEGDGESESSSPTSLAIGIGAEPGSLDALLKSDGARDSFALSVYEGLTRREGGEVVPSLATEWKRQGSSWIFTLRDGVKFHNGQTLTAADVVASWERILSDESELVGANVDEGTEVEAVDDMTVSITRPTFDPTIPVRASLVLIAPEEFAAPGDDRLTNEMVGTGPYEFVSWEKGTSIELAAFDGYWGEKPSIKEVTIRFDPEAAVRLAALETGEIQLALDMPADLSKDSFKTVASPASEVLMLRMNSQAGPLQDIKLREAIALAVDRQVLIEEIFAGRADDAKGQIVTSATFGHDPDLEGYPYDPERARQLVQEAGAEGTELELLATQGRWIQDAEVAEAVAAMLEEIGLRVKVSIPDFDTFLERLFVAGTDDSASPDLLLGNHSNQLFDASLSFGQFVTCEAGASTTCIEEVDRLAARALKTADEAEREDLYHQAWQVAKDNYAFVGVADVFHVAFMANDLQWTPPDDGFLRIQDMTIGN